MNKTDIEPTNKRLLAKEENQRLYMRAVALGRHVWHVKFALYDRYPASQQEHFKLKCLEVAGQRLFEKYADILEGGIGVKGKYNKLRDLVSKDYKGREMIRDRLERDDKRFGYVPNSRRRAPLYRRLDDKQVQLMEQEFTLIDSLIVDIIADQRDMESNEYLWAVARPWLNRTAFELQRAVSSWQKFRNNFPSAYRQVVEEERLKTLAKERKRAKVSGGWLERNLSIGRKPVDVESLSERDKAIYEVLRQLDMFQANTDILHSIMARSLNTTNFNAIGGFLLTTGGVLEKTAPIGHLRNLLDENDRLFTGDTRPWKAITDIQAQFNERLRADPLLLVAKNPPLTIEEMILINDQCPLICDNLRDVRKQIADLYDQSLYPEIGDPQDEADKADKLMFFAEERFSQFWRIHSDDLFTRHVTEFGTCLEERNTYWTWVEQAGINDHNPKHKRNLRINKKR